MLGCLFQICYNFFSNHPILSHSNKMCERTNCCLFTKNVKWGSEHSFVTRRAIVNCNLYTRCTPFPLTFLSLATIHRLYNTLVWLCINPTYTFCSPGGGMPYEALRRSLASKCGVNLLLSFYYIITFKIGNKVFNISVIIMLS